MASENTQLSNMLLVTNKLESAPRGGRQLLSKLIYEVFRDLYSNQVSLIEITRRPVTGLISIRDAFFGLIDGLDRGVISHVLQKILDTESTLVFIDGSNFGALIKAIKDAYPNVQVFTFFHNVEARFFYGAFKESRTIRSLGILAANYFAEKKSVRYSDKIVCLSNRDSNLLKKIYGRNASDISPMALRDKLKKGDEIGRRTPSTDYVLFVGGAFYANVHGIRWYIKNVAPKIRIKTYVVGKGLEELNRDLVAPDNVVIIGEAKTLDNWYLDSQFVVSPIFDGSGMKTKVAEALMFGKKIIGTPEAFSGYEDIAEIVGQSCTSPNDFITAINTAAKFHENIFDETLREIYELNYSYSAAKVRFQEIINNSQTVTKITSH